MRKYHAHKNVDRLAVYLGCFPCLAASARVPADTLAMNRPPAFANTRPSRGSPAWQRLLHRALALACAAGLAFSAASASADTLRIGSKRFTESYILAQVLAQTAAPHLSTAPEVRQGLGNTAIVYEALRAGSIDLYPEYAGTIGLEILKSPQPLPLDAMRRALAPLGFGVAVPLGFNDGYALALRAADAERLNIRTLSDLARHPQLQARAVATSSSAVPTAGRAWPPPTACRRRPPGSTTAWRTTRIAAQQVDVIDIYTTDAKIDHLRPARAGTTTAATFRATTRWCCTGWTCPRAFRRPGPRCRRWKAASTRPR